MPGVRLSDPVVRGALVLSGGVPVRVLYHQGHPRDGPLAARQHVVLPRPGDRGHRVPGRPALHLDGGALEDVQGRRLRDVVYPGRHWKQELISIQQKNFNQSNIVHSVR